MSEHFVLIVLGAVMFIVGVGLIGAGISMVQRERNIAFRRDSPAYFKCPNGTLHQVSPNVARPGERSGD